MLTSGFPSPAEDFREKELDLDALLVKNPSSTFFLRASGEKEDLTGIHEGDILIVDRSIYPDDGDLVIYSTGRELEIGYFSSSSKEMLHEHTLWGAITWIIHSSRA